MSNITNLMKLSATVAVLNQKLNNIHFNYKGEHFRSVHLFTEELYKEGLELYDDLSEKIAMQNQFVPASFKKHLELTEIQELGNEELDVKKVSQILVEDLSTIIELTERVETSSTIQPLLDEVFMVADKYRWIFKSMV